jgi:hypothetical protein
LRQPRTAQVFDPLSNETRLKIVDRLKDGERCYWTGVILCIGDPAPSRMAEALVPSMRGDAARGDASVSA